MNVAKRKLHFGCGESLKSSLLNNNPEHASDEVPAVIFGGVSDDDARDNAGMSSDGDITVKNGKK